MQSTRLSRSGVWVRIDAVKASFLTGTEYQEATKKDPYLKVRFGKLSLETPHVTDSLEPEWNRRYAWPLETFVKELSWSSSAFDVKIANKNVFRSSFMGGYVAADEEIRQWLDEATPESLSDRLGVAVLRLIDLTLSDVQGDDLRVVKTFKLYPKKEYKAMGKLSRAERNARFAASNAHVDEHGNAVDEDAVGVVTLALSLGAPPATWTVSVQDSVLARLNSILGPSSDYEAKFDAHGRIFYLNHAAQSVTYEAPPQLAAADLNSSIGSVDDTSMWSVGDGSLVAHVASDDESVTSAPSEDSDTYAASPVWWRTKQLGPMPPGWELGSEGAAKPYFINHSLRKTTWDDPRVPGPADTFHVDVQTVLAANAPLEDGWERRVMAVTHRLYYINIDLWLSQWNAPGEEFSELESYHDEVRGAFPPGWERKIMGDGSVFYVNHLSKSTTWTDPRLASESGDGAGPSMSTAAGSADATGFQNQLAALHNELPSVSGETLITVSRDRLFEDAYQRIMALDSTALKRYFRVQFDGEAGLDYGGLSREFFTTISQSMFSPYYGLFEYCGSDTGTLQINKHSGLVADDHLRLFRLVGRTIGLAIRNGKLMEAYFTPAFYKHLLRRPATLRDMQSYDLETYNSLAWASSNSIDNILFETFSVVEHTFGTEVVIDLIPDGRNIDVTDANKARYIGLLMNYYLFDSVEEQMEAIRTGIADVFDLALLERFDSRQLEYLISGLGTIDVDDWQAHTTYSGPFSSSHKQIRWFWDIVRSFNDEERSRLLSFATGTSRVPLGGFAHLVGSNGPKQFELDSLPGSADRLMYAHSCFNRINMPVYPSRAVFENKLRLSIMESAGFDIA
ncbi:ubiquitin-protein ligase E3 [Thecamonas trahens ATCC 50062]|uniref:HECT-type E3 ubiquitin transferase n=1 Tax=Thecamonas trahens ATCC 50062 TaxID=461836 RepID=A0A0L0DSL0_THETB|nr:ubiquitin-protein ligase E3 [Thecamonas trahens ATCC 50062]KNC54438.1 ubiquitin-protein ligase E3 [Thecamonas trahens ATCC 50062]|eukprot:XP_013753731.1 ubiquitin-protein ligase E3 [Thecamonas trahens ATCC 50062]